MSSLVRALLGGVALAVLAPACADEAIPLATIPASDAGIPQAPTRCLDSFGCPSDSYCAKESCGDAAGTCQLAQVVCTEPAPVCGCDGITYFNDCLRQGSGIVASTPGQCQNTALHCGGLGGESCPTGATCAQLQRFHDQCSFDVPGTCWVLPSNCPDTPGTDLWDSCDNGPQCVDTCTAIKSGARYRRAGLCP
jgi:hypothetical protein